MAAPRTNRHDPRAIRGRDDRADPVAAEDGKAGDGGRDGCGQVGLPPPDGPEVEAGGSVEEDRDVEVALLDGVANVRDSGPREHGPVHAANVVAGNPDRFSFGTFADFDAERYRKPVAA